MLGFLLLKPCELASTFRENVKPRRIYSLGFFVLNRVVLSDKKLKEVPPLSFFSRRIE